MAVTQRQLKCRGMLEALGYSRAGASALVGNFSVESGVNLPTAYRAPKDLDHGSQGLAQWRLTRLDAYQDWVRIHGKFDHADDARIWFGRMDNQVEFVSVELKNDYPKLNEKLRESGDVAALTADVCWQYERPNKALAHIAERIAYATAVAAAPTPVGTPGPVAPEKSVTGHLRDTVATHQKEASGGWLLAIMSVLAGVGLTVSNVFDQIPLWEWGVFAVLIGVFVVGIFGAKAQADKAKAVAAAIPGVSKVPAPVDPEPVPLPAKPVPQPLKPAQVYTADQLADAVKAAVAAELAKINAGQVPIGSALSQAMPLPTMSVNENKPSSTGGAFMGVGPGPDRGEKN